MALSRALNRSDMILLVRPAEIIPLTDPGWPMDRRLAIQSFDTVVLLRRIRASRIFHLQECKYQRTDPHSGSP